MPSTSVYLVSPRRMAAMAASLTLSGVSKSGSPVPRLITSRPSRFSSRARALVARVADGLTRARAADCRLDMATPGKAPTPYAVAKERSNNRPCPLRSPGRQVGRRNRRAGRFGHLVDAGRRPTACVGERLDAVGPEHERVRIRQGAHAVIGRPDVDQVAEPLGTAGDLT